MLYYGRLLHMTKAEILVTRYGEMTDMIACHAIQNGAEPKNRHKMTFEEALMLR